MDPVARELVLTGLTLFMFLIFLPVIMLLVAYGGWREHQRAAAVVIIVGVLLYTQRVYAFGEHLLSESISIALFVAGMVAMTAGCLAVEKRQQ